MRNCIIADVRRVQRKISYIVCISIELVLILIAGILSKIFPLKMLDLTTSAESMREGYAIVAFFFFSLLVGIPIFTAIYSDDFKSHSMQTVIGFGLIRRKVIWARFFECLLLLVETGIIFSLVLAGMCLWNGVGWNDIIELMVVQIWIRNLKILGFLCISLIIVYGTQKPGGGMVLFILFLTGVFGTLISAMDLIPFFEKHKIEPSKYVPSGVVYSIQEAILSGKVLKAVLTFAVFAVCYVILPVVISIGIFEKKELEF